MRDKLKYVALLLLAATAPLQSAFWNKPEVSGYLAGESRLFLEGAGNSGQSSRVGWSGSSEVELLLQSKDSSWEAELTPFIRLDANDSERTHVDLREAYLHYFAKNWEVKVGVSKVFWQPVRLAFPHVGADGLNPGPVGRDSLVFVAASPEYLGLPQSGIGGQLQSGAGLANARLSHQGHHPAPAR